MKNILLVATVLVFSAATAACAKKVSSPEDFGFGPKSRPKVTGPNLSGQWDSGCIDSAFGPNSKRRITMDIEQNKMTHVETDFSDSLCVQQYQVTTLKGTFDYEKQLPNGVYTIEFKIPLDANVSTLRWANVSFVAGELKFSDWAGGFDDMSSVVPELMFTPRQAGLDPAPTPATGDLEVGFYQDSSGYYCDQSISTMKSGGKVATVYLDLMGNCSGTQFVLSCKDGYCTDSKHDLRILSATSFSFIDLRDGVRAVFEKQ